MSIRAGLYLICYDIADPKRLGQVARYLEKHGCRVQYSVFVAQVTERELDGIVEDLAEIINPREDDIRCYPLPEQGEVALMGRQIFPEDVLLLQNGHNVLRLREGASPRRRSKKRHR